MVSNRSFRHIPCRAGYLAAVVLFAALAVPLPARAQNFSDDFEGAVLDPFWSIAANDRGSATLSTDNSQSGFQSLKLTGFGGGQVNVFVRHTFAQETQGTLSVWFYDSGPGLYAGMYVESSDPSMSHGYALNVADWNSSTYVWHHPGISATATSIPRTVGWHRFELQITANGFDALIDNVSLGTLQGSFTFNQVSLLIQGPGQTGSFYFDDFRYLAPLSVPSGKDDCKDGGWQHLVRADDSSFRNQGACVSYVNTGR